jgi:hypothetical protein
MIYIPFVQDPNAQFVFQIVLDGSQYNCTVTYNVFGQRYYVNVYTVQGALVMASPLTGSPDGYDIDLMRGKFTSTLVYRTSSNQFEVSEAAISYPDFGARDDYMRDASGNILVLDGAIIN